MSVQYIQTSDTLGSGFRVKYNASVAEIITAVTDVGNGSLNFQKFNSEVFNVTLTTSFFTKQQVNDAISAALAATRRANDNVSANGSAGQVITYSTPMTSAVRPIINDYNGLGIIVTAFDANGFTITSLTSGYFGYLTTLNQ